MKHPENPSLLAGIIADPEDDAPRLVYADWLDEHGDPDRAEFIRVQCALADMSPAEPDYVGLTERKREVLVALGRRSLGPKLPEAVGFYDNWYEDRDDSGASYHRGFPYFASEPYLGEGLGPHDALCFRDALPEVIETTTLRGLHFSGPFSLHLAEVLDTPAAAHLSALSVGEPWDAGHPGGTVDAILSSPAVPNLRWLDLGPVSSTAADALARAPALGRVRRLEVPGMVCGPAALKRLAAAGWFGRLRRVMVRLTGGNASVGVAALSKLPDLHTLELYDLPAERLSAFAQPGRFPALGRLFLRAPLRKEGAVLARAALPRLAVLTLKGCWLHNEDLIALSRSGWFPQLRALSLGSNAVGDKGVAAIADSPAAATLRVLRLGDNKFGRGGLATLARPGAFPDLTTLDLGSSLKRKASAEDVTRFLAGLHLPRLRHLDLHGWPVGDSGAKALAANPAFANLTFLNLAACGIGPRGAAALFASPHLRRLLKLELSLNRVGKSVESLLDPSVLPELRDCRLPSGDVSEELKERIESARGVPIV